MRVFLRQCWLNFIYAGVFGAFINLLLLTMPLYSDASVRSRLTSRSVETLLVLTRWRWARC